MIRVKSEQLLKHNQQPKTTQNFRSRWWGSSLPGLRTLDPPLSPQSTPAEIFRCTCLGGVKKNNKFLINFLAISGDSKHFSFFSKKTLKHWLPRGQRGPQICFHPKSYFLCDLKPHKSNARREREKNAVNSGHLVPWQRTQAARTNSNNSCVTAPGNLVLIKFRSHGSFIKTLESLTSA